MTDHKATPETLREALKDKNGFCRFCCIFGHHANNCVGVAAADAWDEERKSHEVLRSGIRSLWHSIVDGDMDRISAANYLKELFR